MLGNATNQRGVALFLAMFALLIVTAVAMGMMYLADTETTINANYRDNQLAYYAARAGLEEVRDRIRANAGAGITINTSLPAALPGQANGVLYILNPAGSETVAPWLPSDKYFDDEICTEVDCSGGQVPPISNWYINPSLNANANYVTNPVLPYKWVRINRKTNRSAYGTGNILYVSQNNLPTAANDPVCWNGTHEFASPAGCVAPNKPVYMLTALALTPSGSRRMVQYELTQIQLNLAFPAALTFDGQGDALFPANSNVYYVDGNDHAACGGAATQAPRPAIAVPNDTDDAVITGQIPRNRRSHYIGSGPAPDVQIVDFSNWPNLQTVSSLEATIAAIKNVADYVIQGSAASLPSYGSVSSPEIIYVNGDLTLSGNITGYGVLVVTGTYTAAGTVGWRGIVLVVGQGTMVVSGGGNNEYDGAVLLAKTRDASGNLLSTLGGTTLDWSGGGGNGVFYSSGCVNNANSPPLYQVIAFRESAK